MPAACLLVRRPARTRPSLLTLALVLALVLALYPPAYAQAATLTIDGPPGSGFFGTTVTLLPNGNLVIADSGYDLPGPIADVGAVYLYDGRTLAQLSMLTGSAAGDQVGLNGVIVLTNGNYVVLSPWWNNGPLQGVGAATWGSATTGVSGVVSAANSLVGASAGDRVGAYNQFGASAPVTALANGNYVVHTGSWDNGPLADAGAVTWGDGSTGVTGVVSITNSLTGASLNDRIAEAVTALPNGNYVVRSPNWDNGPVVDAGAVTWADGAVGLSGLISTTNSLVGKAPNDFVGGYWLAVLANGNYVIQSPLWDNDAVENVGAVTWGDGATGITGVVSVTNSLVGGSPSDSVGSGIVALTNGNYVVQSPYWANGPLQWAGAATWGNGAIGTTGVVSVTNSLVGGSPLDQVGFTIVPLTNGNYVVQSPGWDNGASQSAGAVTWGNGTTGTSGLIAPANSLTGASPQDAVGSYPVTALANGNYVVASPAWDNGALQDVGAATWGNGATGTSGLISPANSLTGSHAHDRVGYGYVTALTNGNYVVNSPNWDSSPSGALGAVTWGNGATGSTGLISAANSLVGTNAGEIGNTYITALANGNYVVVVPTWDSGSVQDAGAVTWADGNVGLTGHISTTNSLYGTTAFDRVGLLGATALPNGNYVVNSVLWDNGPIQDAGAVTLANGFRPTTGPVTRHNSLVGTAPNDRVGGLAGIDIFNGVTPLGDDFYTVISSLWRRPPLNSAISVASRCTPLAGPINETNSLLNTYGHSALVYDPATTQVAVGIGIRNQVLVWRGCDHPAISTSYQYLPVVRR